MRRMHFNAFNMVTPSHHAQGLWAEPDSRQLEYANPELWIELARVLERGCFDSLFLADVIAPYEKFRGSRDPAVSEGMQVPTLDPWEIAPLVLQATENLGVVCTQNVLQEQPFAFARRVSTLDMMFGGRVGWNIVNSFVPGVGRHLGLGGLPEHGELYERAEEFTRCCTGLWEHSWDDDAVLADGATGQFADPAKVHDVFFSGRYYRVAGPHMTPPTPQRTPFLFQAGMSDTGRAFAARHAEALFINPTTPHAAAPVAAKIREAVRVAGRDPDDVRIFVPLAFIVGSTEAEARQRHEDLLARQLRSRHIVEANLARMSAFFYEDLYEAGPDRSVREAVAAGGLSPIVTGILSAVAPAHQDQTVGQALLRATNDRFAGTPEQIAEWIAQFRDAGVDGINLQYVVSPGSFIEFVDHVVPVLQARGLMQRDYGPGPLRQKMFPHLGPRLPAAHPARQTAGLDIR